MEIIKINPKDSVAVVLLPISAGQEIEVGGEVITTLADMPFGHKIALTDISEGNEVIKYGAPIGIATSSIKAGEHVHTHNLKTGLTEHIEYTYEPGPAVSAVGEPAVSMDNITPVAGRQSCFMGFKRESGKVGIRNEIWVIPTVGCINSTSEATAKKAQNLLRGSVQGVYPFPHPYGCSQLGEDHKNTQRALCGLAKHPNAGGVLILGLGCENNTVDEMRKMLGDFDETRVRFLLCQDVDDEISAAIEIVDELISIAENDKREPVSASELIVGLKCGGSDGLSGITANPLVGTLTDRLAAEGGSAILTEVPEMFGAETILMNRCESRYIFDKTVRLISDFKEYFISHNQPVYENPSPGNKKGGISTLEDKSLGCTQKAGNAAVVDVLSYGEVLSKKGLNLLNSPGNDLVASTALAASGAHIILFTTGRGTPFGSPVPTVKISSNTPLYDKKRNWIDFNAGSLTDGVSLEDMADELYSYVLKLASGEIFTKTEVNGIREMAIFRSGVTL
jgi:altronate hydrolase